MGFKCGIVGLPNVGKSTLFNALTESAAAQAANYPFCTIEPNVGDVPVPDPRLAKLSGFACSAQTIPTRLTFVDIAGLVRGASLGEGLGNRFLAQSREVGASATAMRPSTGARRIVSSRAFCAEARFARSTSYWRWRVSRSWREIAPRSKTSEKRSKVSFEARARAAAASRADW